MTTAANTGIGNIPRLAIGRSRCSSMVQPSLVELQRLKGGGAAIRGPESQQQRSLGFAAAAAFYPLLGAGLAAMLGLSNWQQPIWTPHWESLSWCRSWLLAVLANYYGACVCLCGIILSSETPLCGVLWCTGCCLVGTPMCCAYLASRLLRHGTLCLAR